jgi:hypothetical protein
LFCVRAPEEIGPVRFYRILFVVGIVILATPTTGHAHGEDVLRALIGEILVFIATIAVSLSTVPLPWQCRCFLVVVIVLLHAVSLQIVSDMPYRKNRNTIDAIIVGLPALGWLIAYALLLFMRGGTHKRESAPRVK